MSLGILKVAAVLEQRGRQVEVVDLSGIDNYEDAICHHASQSGARHFGITQELTSRITAFDRPRHFRDEMEKGAFPAVLHCFSSGRPLAETATSNRLARQRL